MFEQTELCLLYESLRMYRQEFSTYLQALRQTEFQFAAANIALAKIEVLLRKVDSLIVKETEINGYDLSQS